MKTTIEKIFSARILALVVAVCATGGAWADPALTMSGYVSVDSENPSVAFTGVTLDELMTKYKLSGDMGGGHALPVGAATACIAKLNDGALTVQFQRVDGSYCKCVYVKFTEDTSVTPTQIKAVATAAKYSDSVSKFGTDADSFTNSKTPVGNDSDGGYGICNLELTPRAYSADSININFTHDSANLTTLVEQGLAAYAVSGILWDNMSGANGSLATVHKTASDGTYSTVAGASITVSGALGSYRCENLTSENDLRHGYVDDVSSVAATPQIAITGIPFDNYRLVVYHACEAANTAFGYDTIGGVNYKVANGATIVASGTDTDAWGNSGALNSAETIAVGVNCLVSPVISGSSLTIVGHWLSGGRTGIAAIQIVEADSTPVTYSASMNSNTAWSDVSWADSKTWSNDGDAIVTISTANSPTLTFDESVTACGIFLGSDAGGVTLTGTKPTAGIDYSGIAGEVTYGFLCSDPICSRTAGLKLTGGAGAEEAAIAFTPAGGSITFDGSGNTPYYLSFGNSGTSTTINFNDAEVVTSSFDLGTATAIVGGDSDITATRVILSQGANSRTASLTVKDSAKLTVTGTTNADQNTASIMFGHWKGPSTFTLQNSAEFVSEGADVLVGKTGSNHTINIDGGVFNVRGIKLASNASGTNTLNLNGGELQLGAIGITSYSESRTMAVNVKEDAKITTTADSVPITQAVTVDADKTLTLDGGGTITFTSLTLNAGSSLVLVNGTKAVINDGTIADDATINVGTGTINIVQLRPNAVFTFASGGRLEMTEVTSESGTTTLNVADDTMPAVTLYDASGNALAGVIPSISGSTLTITATGGQACWMDYEFNGNGNSIGTDTTALSASSFYDGQAVYIYDTPWRDVNKNSGGWGDEWSAVTRFTNPEINKTVIVTFGNSSAYLGFVSGGKGSVKFVAHSSGGSKEELCTLDISDDPLAPHVYAIKKTATSIAVYLDGVQKYSNDSKAITINQGMQIGSMHGSVADGYYNAGANLYDVDGTPARMDFLRVYKGTISDSAISAIASEFSGISTYTANVISASTLDFSDLEWYEGWTQKAGWPNDYKTKMIVSVADDVTLSLPETLRAYDITFVVLSGKTLTLQCAGNGSSLLTEAGVTIGYTQGVLSYDGTVKIVGSLSAGPISKGADGATLDTAEGSVLNALGSVDVNVTGDGTIVYNRFLPKSGSGTSWTDSSKWTGTVWIKNRTIKGIQLNDYGNAESTVKLTAVSGYLAECTSSKYYTITPAIEVEGSGLDIQNGWGADRLTIRELKGTGTFKSSGGGEGVFHIKKIDNFAGEWNTSKRLFYIGDDTFNVTTATLDGTRSGKVILRDNATVATGKTWTISTTTGLDVNGCKFVVNGSFSGKFLNTGTVTIPASCTTASVDSAWTGTVIVPEVTISAKTGIGLKALSSTGGTLMIKGITRTGTTSIYLHDGSSGNINGTTQLDGDLVVSDGNSGTTFTWNKITGVGNLTLRTDGGTATPITHAITTLDNYTGRIDAKSNKDGKVLNLTIGTVNVPALDLTVGDPLVELASDANLTTSVDAINVTVANSATSHKLYRATNGNLYVKVASVTLDDSSVAYYATVKDAADAALAAVAAGTLTGPATFAIVDSDAPTSLAGWDYSAGTFTKNSNVAYNATKDVAYATLQDAVTASSSGDTLKLVAANSETAVDATGKDFIFDENGYAFSGTWTGSGIIALPSAPVQTSWSSDMFVSTGDTVWTGKVVLGWDIASGVLPLCNYGIAGSTVEVAETFSGWFDASAGDVTISPTIDISGSLTLNNGYSGKIVTFTKVKGSGILTFDCLYTHNITTLENWDGVLTYANTTAGSGSISRIESGSGKVSSVRSFTPTFGDDWEGEFEIKWTHSSGNLNINTYGTANSSVVVGTAVTGGFVGTSNATTTYKPTLVLDAEFKLNNGYAYSGYQNALSNKSVFEAVAGDGNMTFAFTSGYSGYWTAYQVNTFENYGGTITLPERNEIVIGKLKYPSSASASLVPDTKLISIFAHSNSKILNSSLGDVTTAGVPVYVDNVDTGKKVVYKNDGLYLAVAKVGSAYYATLADAIANIGDGYIVPLEDMIYTLTEGQSLKIDNSGAAKITVSPYGGGILGEIEGDGYTMYWTMATISDNAATITPAATGTAVELPSTVTSITVELSSNTDLGSVTAPGVAANAVVVKYGSTVTTGAYTITKVGNVISFAVNETADATVLVGEEEIKVKPEVRTGGATAPMSFASTPAFTIKAIPGLWYAVKEYSTPACDDDTPGTGTAVQAESAIVNPAAPAFGDADVVKYYKVKVGPSKASVQ